MYWCGDAKPYGRSMVGDGYEPDLADATLRGEIELLADVIAAAAEVDGRFTTAQLDHALGLAAQEIA
jgi:hypothetical protein